MNTYPKIIANISPIEDFLKAAHRYGIPMPYDVDITAYSGVRLLVGPDEFDAWLAYLERPESEPVPHKGATHRSVESVIEYTHVPVKVTTIVRSQVSVS